MPWQQFVMGARKRMGKDFLEEITAESKFERQVGLSKTRKEEGRAFKIETIVKRAWKK